MGAPKQKWTPEEEAALRAGVEKYGPGKWRAIQKDEVFGPCLAARSNVDLKDKWRNMSVSANGLGSRDKVAKILASKMKLIGAIPAMSELELKGADTLSITNAIKERKLLGSRYDNFVLEAILSSKDPNGCNKNYIAGYVEAHHPVSSNFRRLLTSKLKFLTLQGKLIKMRQNYTISDNVVFPLEEKAAKYRSRKHDDETKLHFCDSKWQKNEVKHMSKFARDPMKKMRDSGLVKLKVDAYASSRCKTMTAAEAARMAAQAVAEAEVAAAAAEEAAKAAEVAEAEWEAAEAAAEAAAALATESRRESVRTLPAAREEVSVPG